MHHFELLKMPKQELYNIIVTLHSMVNCYEMISQIIVNVVHLYLVLKMMSFDCYATVLKCFTIDNMLLTKRKNPTL